MGSRRKRWQVSSLRRREPTSGEAMESAATGRWRAASARSSDWRIAGNCCSAASSPKDNQTLVVGNLK